MIRKPIVSDQATLNWLLQMQDTLESVQPAKPSDREGNLIDLKPEVMGIPRPINTQTLSEDFLQSNSVAHPLVHYHPEIKRNALAFKEAIKHVANAKGHRRNMVQQRKQKVRVLALVVRHFLTGIRGRIERHHLPAGDLDALHTDVPLPKSYDSTEWNTKATQLIEAEERFVAQGRPPMVNPSIEEVIEAKTIYLAAIKESRDAERDLLSAQAALKQAREESRQLINEIAAYTRYIYAQLEPTVRRRTMRTLGFYFEANPGDPGSSQVPGIRSQVPAASTEGDAVSSRIPEDGPRLQLEESAPFS